MKEMEQEDAARKKETAHQTQTFECPNKENSSEVQPKISNNLRGRRR